MDDQEGAWTAQRGEVGQVNEALGAGGALQVVGAPRPLVERLTVEGQPESRLDIG